MKKLTEEIKNLLVKKTTEMSPAYLVNVLALNEEGEAEDIGMFHNCSSILYLGMHDTMLTKMEEYRLSLFQEQEGGTDPVDGIVWGAIEKEFSNIRAAFLSNDINGALVGLADSLKKAQATTDINDIEKSNGLI